MTTKIKAADKSLLQRRNGNNRSRGKALEKKAADYLQMFRVPYSGTNDTFGWGDLRDVEDRALSRYLGECKSITPRSAKEINYSIKEGWLTGKNGILGKARRAQQIPFLVFSKVRSSNIYAITPIVYLRMFMRALDILFLSGLIDDTKNEAATVEAVDKLYFELKAREEAKRDGTTKRD